MLCVEDLALYEMAQKEATGSHGNETEEQRSQRPTTDHTSGIEWDNPLLIYHRGFYRS